jgi:hypothetical protein
LDLGTIAWENIDIATKKKLKKDILDMFENIEDCTVTDVSEKLCISELVISMGVAELIDEGKLSEGEVESGEIMAGVRQANKRLEKVEKKIDILADSFLNFLNHVNQPKSDKEVKTDDNDEAH